MGNKDVTGQSPKEFFTKKRKIIFTIATVLTIAISFTLGFFVKKWTTPKELSTLEWVISTINKHYYSEEDGVVKEFSAEDYAKAITDGLLDNYSNYYTSQEYSDIVSTNKGNYFGVGISYKKSDVLPVIYKVTGNSPADKAGLKAGDVLVAGEVNGEKVLFESADDSLNFISARKEGEEFKLYFTRNGGDEQSVSVKRQVFVSSYVCYVDSQKTGVFRSEGTEALSLKEIDGGNLVLDEQTAIISLSQFEGGAGEQMEKALAMMVSRGRSKLILDLRSNGGGDMKVLCSIASNFIKEDKAVIAYAVDKNDKTTAFKMDKSKFQNAITSISVVADGGSASATECLIGAMLYYKDCFDINKLVIEKNGDEAKTFGKGIMQTTYKNLTTGEGLKLTTAYIYQPDNKTCIHGKGIRTTEDNSVSVGEGINRAIAVL